jgi:hypothetical protein
LSSLVDGAAGVAVHDKHPSQTEKWFEDMYTLRPNHATQLLVRAESWKLLMFSAVRYPCYRTQSMYWSVCSSMIWISINRIWSDLIHSSHLP